MYHGGAAPLPASVALTTWALAAATFFAVGLTVGGLAGNALAQVVGLALVPLAVLRVHAVPPAALGLALPRGRALAGAALAGACTWYLALQVAVPIIELTGRHEAVRDASRAVTGDGAALPWVLIASALAPGLCEELLHRGVLLPALRARAGAVAALVTSTALFAVMHLEPARIAATALIGLVAGVLALATRSLWPAVTLHVVNNTAALLVGTGQLPALSRHLAAHPHAALALAVLGTLAGLALARPGPQRS